MASGNDLSHLLMVQLNAELRTAQLDLLSAQCATDRLRLRFSAEDLARHGHRDVLHKAIGSANALHHFYSTLEKIIQSVESAVGEENPVDVVKQLTGGIGADYVIECAGSEQTIDQAIHMTNRGGKICLAAFPHEPVTTNIAHLVRNNIYVYGIRGEGKSATHRAMELMAEKRFDATKIHTHTFPLADLPTALRYARERVEDAIKVVVTNRKMSEIASAAE